MNFSLIYFIFALSGFSALIYELIFTYYLKLFLGHSAYSQALVLCVFMGGLTIGSFLSGYFIRKISNPARFYIAVEFLIGIYAICFDLIFKGFINLSYEKIIPLIKSPFYVDLYRIFFSSLLILPQVIILGSTFPLISSFLIRKSAESGKILSYLYFSNTIGGCAGIFATGFFLLDFIGLSETIYIAGSINILTALIFFFLILRTESRSTPIVANYSYVKTENLFFLLFISFLTGFSSFIYEICWIRMLSLVFGSSAQSFEIMLFSFLLGLACGGIYVRNKADKISLDLSYLANIQILMGFCAVVTLPLYNLSFDIFGYFFKMLPKNDFSYHIYNFVTQFISIAIMFPATFFAGMTLPLITTHLIKNNYGESSIGYVYGTNTIGAILGVIVTINLLFPVLGLKDTLITGAIIDILIGIEILIKYRLEQNNIFSKKYIAVVIIFLVILVGYFFQPEPLKLVSGVFRTGDMIQKDTSKLLYYKEGKTASISVVQIENSLSIRTNGKSDSAISINPLEPPEIDEYTLFLLAYLPMLHNPRASTAANIGLGTGITSHILLSNKNIKYVDTIEIEKAVVNAASYFYPYNRLLIFDKRSKIIIDDARNFFIRNKKKYDIIVSEPSNPWISGVASLFTKEFYKIIHNSLSEEGIFVQWLQLYEIDTPLLASVFKAIGTIFADYLVYASNDNELLILAKKSGNFNCFSELIRNQELDFYLNRLKIFNIQDIEIRKIGTKKTLDRFFSSIDTEPNSDFEPLLERRSPKTRFLNVGAGEFLKISNYYIPLLKILESEHFSDFEDTEISLSPYYSRAREAFIAMVIKDMLLKNSIHPRAPKEVVEDMNKFKAFLKNPDLIPPNSRLNLLFGIAISIIPYLSQKEQIAIWQIIENSPAFKKFTDVEKLWFSLFLNITKKNMEEMKNLSLEIYRIDKNAPAIAREYLMAVYFLSSNLLEQKSLESEASINISEHFRDNKIVYDFLKGVCR